MIIAMLEDEVSILRKFLLKSNCYFEFGSGGSTLLADALVSGPIFSVDSSMVWLDKVRSSLSGSTYERRLIYADIGQTGEWGYPINFMQPDLFLNYHERLWSEIHVHPDLYLVDGRFRVACFLQILMRAERDAIIGMHDYRSRAHYHVVERFARPIVEEHDLTFFIRRADVSNECILQTLLQYKYDPA